MRLLRALYYRHKRKRPIPSIDFKKEPLTVAFCIRIGPLGRNLGPKEQHNVIVDFGSEKKKIALVLNAPVFVRMFINSLQTQNKF